MVGVEVRVDILVCGVHAVILPFFSTSRVGSGLLWSQTGYLLASASTTAPSPWQRWRDLQNVAVEMDVQGVGAVGIRFVEGGNTRDSWRERGCWKVWEGHPWCVKENVGLWCSGSYVGGRKWGYLSTKHLQERYL